MRILLLVLLLAAPVQAQTVIAPNPDRGVSYGAPDYRIDEAFIAQARFGNVSGAHDNVVVKEGGGEPTRPDMLVGVGTGHTSAYGNHSAYTFKWLGADNGSITVRDESMLLQSDGTARHLSSIITQHQIACPDASAIDPNLTIDYLRCGLHIRVPARPSNIAAWTPFQVRGDAGWAVFVDEGKWQFADMPLVFTDDTISASKMTLRPIATHTLGLVDPAGAPQYFSATGFFAGTTPGVTGSGAACTITAITGGLITGAVCTP